MGGFAEGACRVTHRLQEGGEAMGGGGGGRGGVRVKTRDLKRERRTVR